MSEVTQRELRNDSGAVLRKAAAGEEITITRNGTPVAVLGPHHSRRGVPATTVRQAFAGAPPLDRSAFRDDIDANVDQTFNDPYLR